MTSGVDPEMLRALVREALADLRPPLAQPAQAGSRAARGRPRLAPRRRRTAWRTRSGTASARWRP